MPILKKLLKTASIFSLIFAQTNITIYNQGRALINEYRQTTLPVEGKQKLVIPNIPNTVDPSSINLISDKIQFISKEFLKRPITTKALLDDFVGKNIELVNYNEDGKISFSTIGKLISNINQPIFEIDGKIVVDPPYNLRFDAIPQDMSDYPFLNCVIQTNSKNNDYHLSYITTGMDWNAEYNLHLTSSMRCNVEGWYSLRNDLNLDFNGSSVSLVSGDVNFTGNIKGATRSQKRMSNLSPQSAMANPQISLEDEYSLFHLPEKIDLRKKSEIRYRFINKNRVPYKRVYHISHLLNRYKYNTETKTEKIPVYVRLELIAEDIGDFQIPAGSYKVYNKNKDILTYIGTDENGISQKMDEIKLEIGKSHDILCTFNLKGYEINRDIGEAIINATFENHKDETIKIDWIENFSDGRWEILEASDDYKQLNAFSTEFKVTIGPNSKKELYFKARIEKK